MADFMQEPVLVLTTMEEVREAASVERGEYGGFNGRDMYRIKSLWLIELAAEISQGDKKFVYNSDIKKLAEERMGFAPKKEAEYSMEGDTLSLLIYNAQNYRRSDALRFQGYEPFTPQMLQDAYERGKFIEVLGENMLGGTVAAKLNPKLVNGTIYAMIPKKRTRHIAPRGQAARIVERDHEAKPPAGRNGMQLIIVSA